MKFKEASTEVRRGQVVYVVESESGAVFSYRSTVAANKDFPGAFDEPDEDCSNEEADYYAELERGYAQDRI
jgi:hypothetical protein